MGHQIFVSYSSKDKLVADAVVSFLERNGVGCWVAPRDILISESYPTAILRGISNARLMLLIFSEHSNNSDQVRSEVDRAFSHGIPIAPLRIKDCAPSGDLEYFLGRAHWLDAMTPPLELHLTKLAHDLKRLLDLPITEPQPALQSNAFQPAASRWRARRMVVAAIAIIICGVFLFADRDWLHFTRQANSATAPITAPAVSLVPVDTHSVPAPVPAATLAAAPIIKSPPVIPSRLGETYTNSIGMKLTYIPAGKFMMGSPDSEPGRDAKHETQHGVTLTRPFLMGVTPVTQAQWIAVMKTNPSHSHGDDLPVEQISWKDAVDFCKNLSQLEGMHYRLPTEAEWEYACRAGTSTAYYTGDDEQALTIAGWYTSNSQGHTHAVGRKKPNYWGLYDMHGNVDQWCSDWFATYPVGDAVDPQGSDDIAYRVLRGGDFGRDPARCRSAHRDCAAIVPQGRGMCIGMRAVLVFH